MAKGLGYWYIEIEKQAWWRGAQHNWVNRYVMSGSDPSASDAQSVIGIIKGIEDQIHPNNLPGYGVGFLEGRAYGAAGGSPLTTVEYNPSGTVGTATGFAGFGPSGVQQNWAPTLETCLLVETRLNGLSSTGKPIFLRKYYRGINSGNDEAQASSVINATYQADVAAAVLPFKTGMGSNSWVVIGTSGAQAAAAPTVHNYLVNHQVPRGKKRKKPSSSSILSDVESLAVRGLLSGGAAAAIEALL